jgi:hypothetical protein
MDKCGVHLEESKFFHLPGAKDNREIIAKTLTQKTHEKTTAQ